MRLGCRLMGCLLVDGVLEALAGLEGGRLAGGDLDLLAGAGLDAFAGGALTDFERAEARDLHAVAVDESVLGRVEQGVDGGAASFLMRSARWATWSISS